MFNQVSNTPLLEMLGFHQLDMLKIFQVWKKNTTSTSLIYSPHLRPKMTKFVNIISEVFSDIMTQAVDLV